MVCMSRFLTTADYLALPRPKENWLIKDILPAEGLTNVFGMPKQGKSFAVLGMAVAIASGEDYWLLPDYKVLQQGPVCYLQPDTPRPDWAKRLVRYSDDYDLSQLYTCDRLMIPEYPMNVMDPKQQKWLTEALADIKPLLVVVDTLREIHGGDENDSTVMRNVISQTVAAAGNAAIVFISHARKPTGDKGEGDLMSDARGSSYVAGRMDMVIRFTKKHMTVEGRMTEKATIEIEREEGSGHVLAKADAAAYWKLLHTRIPQLHAQGMNASNIGRELAAEVATDLVISPIAGKPFREIDSITKHVKAFMADKGWFKYTSKGPKRGIGKSPKSEIQPASLAGSPEESAA